MIAMVMLTSCNGTVESWNGLHMQVTPGSVTPTGLRLTMVNDNAEMNFGYGSMFRIEHQVAGIWREVPRINDVFWTLVLYNLNPNSAFDDVISWEHIYGELQPGRYRIVRNFKENDGRQPLRYSPSAYLFAIFNIE